MEATKTQLPISCSQMRLSFVELGYSQLNCWLGLGVSHGNPPKTQAVAKIKCYSLKTHSRASMLRPIPIEFIEYEGIKLDGAFISTFWPPWYGRVFGRTMKEKKRKQQPQNL